MRTLKPNEISVRAERVVEREDTALGVFLLYTDSRSVMDILDSEVGSTNWKADYYSIGTTMFCTISIYDKEKKEWIGKSNAGEESNISPEKGQASDSFKRASVLWGISRELYTSPRIFIELNDKEVYTDKKTNKLKISPYITFRVKEIEYNEDREIVKLVIVDKSNVVRFSYGSNVPKAEKQNKTKTEANKIDNLSKTQDTLAQLKKKHDFIMYLVEQADKQNVSADNMKLVLKKCYGADNSNALTLPQAEDFAKNFAERVKQYTEVE